MGFTFLAAFSLRRARLYFATIFGGFFLAAIALVILSDSPIKYIAGLLGIVLVIVGLPWVVWPGAAVLVEESVLMINRFADRKSAWRKREVPLGEIVSVAVASYAGPSWTQSIPGPSPTHTVVRIVTQSSVIEVVAFEKDAFAFVTRYTDYRH